MQAASHLRVSMASCELDRTAAYSEDLRWWMVYKRIGVGRSYKNIAESLSVVKRCRRVT